MLGTQFRQQTVGVPVPGPVFTFGPPEEPEIDPEKLDAFLARLDADTRSALEQNLDDRDGFQDRLYRDYGRGLDAMDLLYFSALEAWDWAKDAVHEALTHDDDREPFDHYYGVLRGLAARALVAYAETTWLLRGGYPQAALTRVRLLHELFVTAALLAQHGSPDGKYPELVDRYLEHREVFTRATADDLIATGTFDPGEFFDDDVLNILELRKAQLLDDYGKNFGHMWGWAAPLFPGKNRISMKMIDSLVMPELHYFYSTTSAHVHAGSEGWHETIVEHGEERVLASGSTNVGLTLPAVLATAFLLELVRVVVPTCIESEGVSIDTGGFFQAAIARMSTSIGEHMSAGEAAVTRAEERYQTRLRQRTKPDRPPRIRGLALLLVHRAERRLRRSL